MIWKVKVLIWLDWRQCNINYIEQNEQAHSEASGSTLAAVSLTFGAITIAHSKTGCWWGGFENTPQLEQLKPSIIQSSPTVHGDAAISNREIMKVSSAPAQRETGYIFHRQLPFIIHGNHLESEA